MAAAADELVDGILVAPGDVHEEAPLGVEDLGVLEAELLPLGKIALDAAAAGDDLAEVHHDGVALGPGRNGLQALTAHNGGTCLRNHLGGGRLDRRGGPFEAGLSAQVLLLADLDVRPRVLAEARAPRGGVRRVDDLTRAVRQLDHELAREREPVSELARIARHRDTAREPTVGQRHVPAVGALAHEARDVVGLEHDELIVRREVGRKERLAHVLAVDLGFIDAASGAAQRRARHRAGNVELPAKHRARMQALLVGGRLRHRLAHEHVHEIDSRLLGHALLLGLEPRGGPGGLCGRVGFVRHVCLLSHVKLVGPD